RERGRQGVRNVPGGVEFVDHGNIAPVPSLLDPATESLLVLFDGHVSPLLACAIAAQMTATTEDAPRGAVDVSVGARGMRSGPTAGTHCESGAASPTDEQRHIFSGFRD